MKRLNFKHVLSPLVISAVMISLVACNSSKERDKAATPAGTANTDANKNKPLNPKDLKIHNLDRNSLKKLSKDEQKEVLETVRKLLVQSHYASVIDDLRKLEIAKKNTKPEEKDVLEAIEKEILAKKTDEEKQAIAAVKEKCKLEVSQASLAEEPKQTANKVSQEDKSKTQAKNEVKKSDSFKISGDKCEISFYKNYDNSSAVKDNETINEVESAEKFIHLSKELMEKSGYISLGKLSVSIAKSIGLAKSDNQISETFTKKSSADGSEISGELFIVQKFETQNDKMIVEKDTWTMLIEQKNNNYVVDIEIPKGTALSLEKAKQEADRKANQKIKVNNEEVML
jgi:hypothetical protein